MASGFGLENISSDGIRDFEFEKSFIGSNHVMDLELINDQFLWAGTENGILRIDVLSEQIIRFNTTQPRKNKRLISDNFIRDLLVTKDGSIWAGTKSGITIIDTVELSATSFNSEFTARVLFQDANENIWIGTDFNGLYKIPALMIANIKEKRCIRSRGTCF